MIMWVIKDLYHSKGVFLYITEGSTLEDLWQTHWPVSRKLDDDYNPKVFTDLSEAKRYLKEIKRQSARDWAENSHIHKLYGYNKYEWDIYEHRVETLTNE